MKITEKEFLELELKEQNLTMENKPFVRTYRFPTLMATRDECIFNFPVSNRNVNFYNESTWNDNADILF